MAHSSFMQYAKMDKSLEIRENMIFCIACSYSLSATQKFHIKHSKLIIYYNIIAKIIVTSSNYFTYFHLFYL